jgi:hypothetical protein
VDEDERRCGHCGRDGATAWAAGAHLCHTDDPARPDCYRRVTVYAESVGALLGFEVQPAGIKGITGRDGNAISPQDAALAALAAMSADLGLYDTGPDCG